MTNQEMLDKAVRGLRSQSWQRCVDQSEGCVYDDGNGRHCAWGWVDPASWKYNVKDDGDGVQVQELREMGVGVAACITAEQLEFAKELQSRHDNSSTPERMMDAFRQLAHAYGLVFPEAE